MGILMKNDWEFTAPLNDKSFIDVKYMQKVLLNDIVQFRLIEFDNKKLPILVDEATPHQREEYHGVDPLATVTATSRKPTVVPASTPSRGVLTESNKSQNLK